jgi:hypothetical protein
MSEAELSTIICLYSAGALASSVAKARADVGEVGTERLRREDRAPAGDAAGQNHAAVVELAHLGHECERRQPPRVAAGAARDEDQAVHSGGECALGVRDRRYVMEHEAAVAVRRFDHRVRRAQARDHDRHLVLYADIQVLLQPLIARVHDLIDGEGRDPRVRMPSLHV